MKVFSMTFLDSQFLFVILGGRKLANTLLVKCVRLPISFNQIITNTKVQKALKNADEKAARKILLKLTIEKNSAFLH
jgi:hypothetical protein